jgi:dTDP-4-dehydrorhamnose reductase
MLGHKLVQRLTPRFETWATVRGDRPGPTASRILDPTRTVTGVRAEEPESVIHALEQSDATTVVNAIGIIKQLDAARAAIPSIRVNALFPHELATACASRDSRLIHISTDCVFSGDRGSYTEDSIPDARDLYGRSKLLGEVTDAPHAITLRTSIVGRELHGALGLFEWFLSQRGSRVRGFSRAIFSGVTTPVLSDLIGDLIEREKQISGLWQVSAAAIDKLTLLSELRDALGVDIEIDPDDSLVIDRSLDSSRFQSKTGWTPPTWRAMLADLAADPTPYEELRHLDPDR